MVDDNSRKLTPREAHLRLVEIEKERDKHREPIDIQSQSREPEIEKAVEIVEKRLASTRRVTAAISPLTYLSLLRLCPSSQTVSEWIRDAINQRIERERQNTGQK